MAYTHGIYVQENPTSIIAPITADSAVQFVVGTAPINLLADPSSAVNKPSLVYSFKEAQEKIGYSDDFEKFSLCQSIDASFRVFNVAPLLLINVLDPAVHVAIVDAELLDIVNKIVTIEEEGILLNETFVVKDEAGLEPYVKDTDYTVEFIGVGYPQITVLIDGTIGVATKLSVSYNQLDPTMVTEAEIVGGYDSATAKYKGLENITLIYPMFGIVPGLILSPGWSHKPTVSAAITAKYEGINGSFKANGVKDIDTIEVTEYTQANAWKNDNSYINKHDIVCWPMVKIGDKKYYKSALVAALIAYTDASNDNVPFVSPSNKSLRITGTILDDGTEVYLDQVQANLLNGQGIVTAINVNGWKLWGNNTGIYPSSTDPKDRWIPVRRMFDWWGNSFIMTYFQKVDDPMNRRLIEAVVDSENIRANGYKARFQLADARIEFNAVENPITDLLNGTIQFKQYLTPFAPAETMINVLEFDPTALTAALE
ncbi:MAG: phage tail sheath protein FI [Clostridium sp.]|jgi:phage tail sheath protein FI